MPLVDSKQRGTGDPLWYKDAIIYEVHVRSFFDSNGDGIGDFAGLTRKLDYLEDLGVNTLWLLPFYPSPLKDDGYDISDYTQIHPTYGTMADFRSFLREAHRRGLRVITELVLNHTSDQHRWFQRARQSSPHSRWRNWYVWSPTPDRYREARVIFKDFEPSNWSWDPVAQSYYWHRFYAHQPDLNYDHPEVHEAMLEVVDFWLGLGVDGFRLDAIPYLYEREQTSCENLPETHTFLRKLREHVDRNYPNRLLLAEANQWPEDAVAYFGQGDECHMAFHFPIMTRMFLAVHMEDRFPLIDIISQTPPIPLESQWALFLRNHDELTLEMVTDQERDYMYRVYAKERQARLNLGIRRRLAPLLENNRRKIELLNALLFSLPGTPVLYYGDEIGMGDNIFLGDRNGVRTPMQWNGDRNAGFSRAPAQQLYLPVVTGPEYHYEAVNVEAQQANPQSLLWWMKRLLALSRRFKAFGRGTLELLAPENPKVLAFLRRYREEVILVVINLSRFPQAAELDLGPLKGRTPVELFGRTPFPRIAGDHYPLTLGPHSFFWFLLEPSRETTTIARSSEPLLKVEGAGPWTKALEGATRSGLETALLSHLTGSAWFNGKARSLRGVHLTEAIPLSLGSSEAVLAMLQTDYQDGGSETYSLPLAFASGEQSERVKREAPGSVLARLSLREGDSVVEGVLYDALQADGFTRELLALLERRGQVRTPLGRLAAIPTPQFAKLRGGDSSDLPRGPLTEGEDHTAVSLGDRLLFKWFRHLEEGEHPELEVENFLARRSLAAPVPPLAGHLAFSRRDHPPITLGIFEGHPPKEKDLWGITQDELGRYIEIARSRPALSASVSFYARSLEALLGPELPPSELQTLQGPYLESVRKMAECTARFHQSLADGPGASSFSTEPITPSYQRSYYQSMRRLVAGAFTVLRRAQRSFTGPTAPALQRVLSLESLVLESFGGMLHRKFSSVRIRGHGDLVLKKFLTTGSDLVIVGAPGPGSGSFAERRLKRSPLWDLSCMLHSFHQAAQSALLEQQSRGEVAPDRWPILETGARAWADAVSATFGRTYLSGPAAQSFGLDLAPEIEMLLRVHLLERVLVDLSHEAACRSHRVPFLLRNLLDLLTGPETPPKPIPSE
jgi:maltose alpha-D-glucosyltransferase/alpha-amylase